MRREMLDASSLPLLTLGSANVFSDSDSSLSLEPMLSAASRRTLASGWETERRVSTNSLTFPEMFSPNSRPASESGWARSCRLSVASPSRAATVSLSSLLVAASRSL